MKFPHRIWFYWHQGIDNAPELVRYCHLSWRQLNSGWRITTLSANHLPRYLDSAGHYPATPQAISDLLRINVLRRHGGIWVDASCFCIRPLDDWLAPYMGAGFFAFSNPAPDRMVASWFLASQRGSVIASLWADAANRFWSVHRRPIRLTKPVQLSTLITRISPNLWFTRLVHERIRIYPYYWFHYLFRHLYDREPAFKASWDKSPRFSADVPHAALRRGLSSPIDPDFRREVDRKRAPLYKLNWREGESKEGSVLDYLYQILP